MSDFSIMDSGSSAVNLSEILDVIGQTDPAFAQTVQAADVEMTREPARAQPPQVVIQQQQPRRAYVEIVEQPASKALRFRYECEGRSAGSIPGVNSTPENKTFPTIRIVGCKIPAIVVVSCVTKDPPYRPHPHNLVGKEVCKKGVCRIKLSGDNMTASFDKLGIQCVKRKDIEEALNVREAEQVDPFGTGFDHKRQPTSIDLNAVRLAFQVFLEGPGKGQYKTRLAPVVSEPIYDKKANSDLVICKLSHCAAPAIGNIDMVLLCEKVSKEDIQVRFFEENNGLVVWEAFGEFQPSHVHKQVAISFRTPSYKFPDTSNEVKAYIQLRRPSDGATSEALPFTFTPTCDGRKKPRTDPNLLLLRQLQAEAEDQQELRHKIPHRNLNIVKTEPADRLSPFGGPSVSPPMFYVEPNTAAHSMGGLRPIPSPGRAQSPIINNPMYNIPPVLNMTNQLQPIPTQEGCPSPLLGQNIPIEQEQPYILNNPNILSEALGSALNIENSFNKAQPNQEFNLSLSQLDPVDFNNFSNLSISEIVQGPLNGEAAAAMNDEPTHTDSFTRLARNTINDLCELNDMYKQTRE
ncbi:embryonic polarity protein dorsal-like isoform X2 [Phymastichus coffea]|uniref:embryonic polarity protein dorsal-like isoform X2 n=1 Tax=Phymastichus coffea TaxID=108790 RepID=UPI00273BC871|nr:embryonic polarity protein dorsal-like isoform X2 [Phymastichus coffea]